MFLVCLQSNTTLFPFPFATPEDLLGALIFLSTPLVNGRRPPSTAASPGSPFPPHASPARPASIASAVTSHLASPAPRISSPWEYHKRQNVQYARVYLPAPGRHASASTFRLALSTSQVSNYCLTYGRTYLRTYLPTD